MKGDKNLFHSLKLIGIKGWPAFIGEGSHLKRE